MPPTSPPTHTHTKTHTRARASNQTNKQERDDTEELSTAQFANTDSHPYGPAGVFRGSLLHGWFRHYVLLLAWLHVWQAHDVIELDRKPVQSQMFSTDQQQQHIRSSLRAPRRASTANSPAPRPPNSPPPCPQPPPPSPPEGRAAGLVTLSPLDSAA